MNVTSIGAWLPVNLWPEELRFFTGAALTLLAPPLLFCSVSGGWSPLFLMVVNDALGAALGFVLFSRPPAKSPTCVPDTRSRLVPKTASTKRIKKAA